MTSAESTDSAQGVILARNRRQAMDWSLVLISQGIESVVEPSEDAWMLQVQPPDHDSIDRKSTRLNSSHVAISYAVFCLKRKMNSISSVYIGYDLSPFFGAVSFT